MTYSKWIVASALVCGLGAAGVTQWRGEVVADKGGEDETGPYDVVPNWPQPLHADRTWGRAAAILPESPDRVFAIQTTELPVIERPENYDGGAPVRQTGRAAAEIDDAQIDNHVLLVFNRDGMLVEHWSQHNHLFGRPHRLAMDPYDPQRHLWLVDDGAHAIYKFTNDGKKLVMTLGEFKVPGADRTHFNRPTDLAFLPNGDCFVSDGYGNSRVVKFSRDGRYLLEWGRPGKGPGEFNTVHGLAVDGQQRVYVADRGNARVQVFDAHGHHLDTWPNIRFPTHIAVASNQRVWVADGYTQRMLEYDTNGRLLSYWGTFGDLPGQLWGTHHFSVDSDGNLYVAEVWGGRFQKFTPKTGAPSTRLVGPLFTMPARLSD